MQGSIGMITHFAANCVVVSSAKSSGKGSMKPLQKEMEGANFLGIMHTAIVVVYKEEARDGYYIC
jgi:hypothetical protein